jgi:predicted dienelactone hydrolase
MFAKRLVFVLLIGVLALPALASTPLAGAQEGPKPEAVGLRPDAPPYALHGPYWVGTREFVVEPDSDRPLPLTAWYPALNPEGAVEEIEYHDVPGDRSPILGRALLNAPADLMGGPYPLVIFSHGGMDDNRFGAPYYSEHLASYGFVVLAPDHTVNTAVNAGQSDYRHNIYRPQDVIRVIDFTVTLTSSGEALDGMIDTDTAAVTGVSFGAWTSLAAAGAQMNLKAYKTWCAENRQSDPLNLGLCSSFIGHEKELAALAGLDAVPEGLWPPIADARVKAAIPLAPGGTAAFGAEGLAPVKIPVMIMVGAGDEIPPEYHAYLGYNWLQTDEKALVTFAGADHMFFGWACKDAPWLRFYQFDRCSDPVWDMDRAHDLINHFATAFLLATLKGDTEAAAALAPDAASFPGITYEAQGF